MVMSESAVVKLARDHFDQWRVSTEKARVLDIWARGDSEQEDYRKAHLPPTATVEYEELREVSPTPWGRLLVASVSQVLAVNGHRNANSTEPTTAVFKEVWKLNGLMSRQGALYRAALGQNLGYAVTLPGTRPYTKEPTVRIRGVSATKMAAFYDEEGEDDFARFAMYGDLQTPSEGDPYYAVRIYDDEAVYFLSTDKVGNKWTYITYEPHDVEVTPVHRFSPTLDLNGRATGEIEPFIPLLRRLDQDVNDRLVVQRFNSWRVRYIAGMVKPETPEEEKAAQMMLRITDMLISESGDTKFGTLDPTDIEPYIKAHDADVQDLAAVSQTPPHHLLGQIANLSADALAAAEASLMRKVEEYQLSFGQSWDQVFRSSAFILDKARPGEADWLKEALDYDTDVRWKEAESRSLAQAADALGKVAEQLGVPVEMLWEQLPFWNTEDTERAKTLLEDKGADAMMLQFMDTMAQSNAEAERARQNEQREQEALAGA